MRIPWKTALVLAAACRATDACGQVASFPGAIGFGATATGARAAATPTIYHVTNLNDTGAGSFRDAVGADNRIVVFDVGGNARINTPITARSNLTILGQTAPGEGFGVYGAEVSFYGRHNDVVRYVRFRDTDLDPGGTGTGNSSGNCLNLGNTQNMIFDHVSCEFGSYNNIDAAGTTGADELTFQNSIVANPIASQRFNFHWEGSQGTFANNVFTDGHNRSILSKGNVQYVNNTVYNYQAAFTAGNSGGKFLFDILNNYFITGPSTTNDDNDFYQVSSNQSAYVRGNVRDSNRDGVLNGNMNNGADGATVLTGPWATSTADLPLATAAVAFNFNVGHAGVSLAHDAVTFAPMLGYDDIDAQVAGNVRTLGSAGRLWSSQTQTGLPNGGMGTIATGAKPTDTDNDAVPDAWETLHGMNPAVADSAKLDKLGPLGYTMIEQYASELGDATNTTRVSTTSGGEWNAAGEWGAAAPIVYDIASVRGAGPGTNGLVTVSTTTPVAYQLFIGGNGAAAGEKVQVTAGKLYVQDTILVGNANNATLQIDGGSAQANNVQLGNTLSGTTFTGSLVLNGGTLRTNNVVLGGGTPGAWTTGGAITFNGGTLQALGTTLAVKAPATLDAGGGTIDTNGFAGTVSGVISGSGALNKTGAGVLVLSAANTFTGGANLKGGELSVAADANIGGAATAINFQGGLLQVTGAALTNLDSHAVNWSTFNGGFDIAAAGTTFAVTQNIGGAGSVTIAGLGTVVVSGANTYTGGTVLAGGTLSVTKDNDLGGAGSPISFAGGTLAVNGTAFSTLVNHAPTFASGVSTINIAAAGNVFTIPQTVGGAGGITKSGPGVLVLSGATNSFTGDTNLTAGTLRVGSGLAFRKSTVNLNTAGTTFDLNGINATLGGLAGNQPLDLKGLTIYVGQNTETYTGVISSSVGLGSVVKNGTGTWTVSGAHTYNGPTTLGGGVLNVSTLVNGGLASPLGDSSNAAPNLVFDGGTLRYTGAAGVGTDRLFTLTQNGGTIDGSGTSGNGTGFSNAGTIAFTGTGNRTLNLVGTETHNSFVPALGDAGASSKTSLNVNGTGRWLWQSKLSTYSGDTTITAGTLRLYVGGFLPSGAGRGNVNLDDLGILVADASTGINGLGDGAVGGGTLTVSAGTFTLGNGDANDSFSGVIGGAGGIAKTGTGTQVLSGADTYTGATTVNGGVLQFNSAGGIGGSGASVTVNANGDCAAGYAIDQAFLARHSAASTGTVTLAVNSANNLNFATPALAAVSLGATVNATYSGLITPAANGYRLGGAAGTLTVSAANALSGAASVTIVPGGFVAVTGLNNYSGVTTVGGFLTAATLANGGAASGIGQSTNLPASLVLDGGTLQYNGGGAATDRLFTLTAKGGTIDGSGVGGIGFSNLGTIGQSGSGDRTLTFAGTNGGTGNNFGFAIGNPAGGGKTSLVKSGNGRWFDNSTTSDYSGDTTVAAGDLYAGAANVIPSGPGRGNLVVNGGRFFLYVGNQSVNALNGTGGSVDAGSGRTLTVGNGDASGSYSGVVANGIALVKAGTGTQTLAGTNTYTGGTTITGGTLAVASNANLGAAAGAVWIGAGRLAVTGDVATARAVNVTSPSAGIDVAASKTVALNGTLGGTGTLTKTGPGTLTLGADGGPGLGVAANGGRTTFAVTQHLAALSVAAGATAAGNDVSLFTRSFTLPGTAAAPTAGIDLRAGDLVVTYGTNSSPRSTIEQQVIAGLGGTLGITTSSGSPGGLTLGVADTADAAGITSTTGAAIPTGSVVVRLTYAGDVNLDGSVDTADVGVLLDHFGELADPGGRQWSIGDVNYDAGVDTADVGLALDNFGEIAGGAAVQEALAGLGFTLSDGVETGVANGRAVSFALTGAALPEPASAGAIGIAAAALLRRRRRS